MVYTDFDQMIVCDEKGKPKIYKERCLCGYNHPYVQTILKLTYDHNQVCEDIEKTLDLMIESLNKLPDTYYYTDLLRYLSMAQAEANRIKEHRL